MDMENRRRGEIRAFVGAGRGEATNYGSGKRVDFSGLWWSSQSTVRNLAIHNMCRGKGANQRALGTKRLKRRHKEEQKSVKQMGKANTRPVVPPEHHSRGKEQRIFPKDIFHCEGPSLFFRDARPAPTSGTVHSLFSLLEYFSPDSYLTHTLTSLQTFT